MPFLFCIYMFFLFFFNDTATTEIYTLSLHDALPICLGSRSWMTRLWMRNLTSRKDSRTGPVVMSRAAWADGGVPAGGGAWPGPPTATGTPGDAGPDPGRALSIRLRRDIAYTPCRPEGLTAIAMRKVICSWLPSGRRRRPTPLSHRPPPPRGEGCPARLALPDSTGRTARPD